MLTSTGYGFDNTATRITPSEPHLKKMINKLPSVIEMMMAVDPVTYRYIDPDRDHDIDRVGFLVRNSQGFGGVLEGISDDVLRSNILMDRGDAGLHLRPDHMFPVLWKATQEVWAETQHLLDRMNGLEARVSVLEGRQAVH